MPNISDIQARMQALRLYYMKLVEGKCLTNAQSMVSKTSTIFLLPSLCSYLPLLSLLSLINIPVLLQLQGPVQFSLRQPPVSRLQYRDIVR